MQRIEMRGVVVYVAPKGESHKNVGIYTESGMKYFTVHGARSSKGHSKSALSLCTMGRFIFQEGTRQALKFVDVEIYDSCVSLSQNIEAYYSACAASELTKTLLGAEHTLQFRELVNFLLYLIKYQEHWQIASCVYFWRSLLHNGWHPHVDESLSISAKASLEQATQTQMSSNHFNARTSPLHTVYAKYTHKDGFVAVDNSYIHSDNSVIEYAIVDELLRGIHSPYPLLCMACNSAVGMHTAPRLLKILFDIWQEILGYKLKLSDFMLN